MKARRRVVPGGPTRRTPTVRRIKPAILPAPPKPSVPGGGRATGPAVPGRPSAPAAPGAPERPASAPALDVLGAHPVDLEVDLGRGLVLRTPLLAGAGSLGYGVEAADLVDLDRLGGLVTRGTTLRARPGHRGTRVAEVPGGLLNGVGLQNPGIDAVIERYAPAWGRWRVPVIVNLGGESATDVAECARRLEGVPGVAGIELNLSCANAARGGVAWGMDEDAAGTLTGAVRRATDLPLIVKLTPAAADIRAVARAVEDAGADAISAVNTLPGLAVAADRDGPRLASGYGGISGPALRPVALRVVFEVAQVVDVPVIGLGGVTSLDDVLDLLAVGATAVGITTACFADPMLPVRLADELANACRARGLDSVRPLVGTALPRRASPPSTRGAEYAR